RFGLLVMRGRYEIAESCGRRRHFSTTAACSELRPKLNPLTGMLPAEPTPVAGTAVQTATQAGPRMYAPVRFPLRPAPHTRAAERSPNRIHYQSRCPPMWAGRNIGGVHVDSTAFRVICEKIFQW